MNPLQKSLTKDKRGKLIAGIISKREEITEFQRNK